MASACQNRDHPLVVGFRICRPSQSPISRSYGFAWRDPASIRSTRRPRASALARTRQRLFLLHNASRTHYSASPASHSRVTRGGVLAAPGTNKEGVRHSRGQRQPQSSLCRARIHSRSNFPEWTPTNDRHGSLESSSPKPPLRAPRPGQIETNRRVGIFNLLQHPRRQNGA